MNHGRHPIPSPHIPVLACLSTRDQLTITSNIIDIIQGTCYQINHERKEMQTIIHLYNSFVVHYQGSLYLVNRMLINSIYVISLNITGHFYLSYS